LFWEEEGEAPSDGLSRGELAREEDEEEEERVVYINV